MLTFIFVFLFSTCLSVLLLILFRKLSFKINSLEINYKGKEIPIGTGIIIPAVFLCIYPFVGLIGLINEWMYYCFITLILGIIGFVDDQFGSKEIKGIKGHLLHFYKNKRISTGFAKLIFITMIGFGISLFLYDHVLIILICTITFSIWTNIVNLLDVRPGRAIKGFWIIATVLFSAHALELSLLVMIIAIQSILLFIVDVYELGMLGDSGSNILGGIIGLWMITYSSNLELSIYLIIGGILTMYAEKKSFSQWIEKHPMIQRIDQWGRRKASD